MIGISYVEGEKTFIKVLQGKNIEQMEDDANYKLLQGENIEQMMEDYANNKFYYTYEQDEKYINNITFDNQNYKYLVGYGPTKALLMNMQSATKEVEELKIDTD